LNHAIVVALYNQLSRCVVPPPIYRVSVQVMRMGGVKAEKTLNGVDQALIEHVPTELPKRLFHLHLRLNPLSEKAVGRHHSMGQ
jgi:hypothetical protein